MKGLVNAYALKKELTPEDILAIRANPSLRLTASPMVHNYEDIAFLGRAAPWKGADGIAEVEAINPDVAEGLREAIKISKACANVKGIVKVGDRYLSRKVLCQIEKAKKA